MENLFELKLTSIMLRNMPNSTFHYNYVHSAVRNQRQGLKDYTLYHFPFYFLPIPSCT